MLVPLALMLTFGKFSFLTFFMWMWILSLCGLVFAGIGLTAAHHDPEIFHEGDKPRLNYNLFFHFHTLKFFLAFFWCHSATLLQKWRNL